MTDTKFFKARLTGRKGGQGDCIALIDDGKGGTTQIYLKNVPSSLQRSRDLVDFEYGVVDGRTVPKYINPRDIAYRLAHESPSVSASSPAVTATHQGSSQLSGADSSRQLSQSAAPAKPALPSYLEKMVENTGLMQRLVTELSAGLDDLATMNALPETLEATLEGAESKYSGYTKRLADLEVKLDPQFNKLEQQIAYSSAQNAVQQVRNRAAKVFADLHERVEQYNAEMAQPEEETLLQLPRPFESLSSTSAMVPAKSTSVERKPGHALYLLWKNVLQIIPLDEDTMETWSQLTIPQLFNYLSGEGSVTLKRPEIGWVNQFNTGAGGNFSSARAVDMSGTAAPINVVQPVKTYISPTPVKNGNRFDYVITLQMTSGHGWLAVQYALR